MSRRAAPPIERSRRAAAGVAPRPACLDEPCPDVVSAGYATARPPIERATVTVVLIAEAAAPSAGDWYDAGPDALFARTTVEAFRDAGEDVSSLADVRALGVHVTSAVRCAKVGYALSGATIERCSHLLEQELAQLPNARALLLMGDVAIRAVNAIARRNGQPRVIPAGATYRLRGGEFRFRGARAFPSYLQAGAAFYIERSKRQMIAHDIAAALRHARMTAAQEVNQ